MHRSARLSSILAVRITSTRVSLLPGVRAAASAASALVGLDLVTRPRTVRRHRHDLGHERLRAIWSSSPVGLVEIGLDQRITDCNPAFAAMVGRPRGDVVGQHGWTFFHRDSPPPDLPAMGELLAGSRNALSAERVLRSGDGSPLAVKLDWSVIRDGVGQAAGLACFVTDVSVQATTATALDAARARAEVLWDRAPVSIIEGTPEGIITRVNDAALAMLGRTREELVGTQAAALADPAYAAVISAGVTRLLDGQAYSAERRYLHADGHSVPVHVSTAVLRDEEGQVTRFVGFVVDMSEAQAQHSALAEAVTQVAAAKAELERRQAFTDAVLETVDVGIVSTDTSGGEAVRNRAMRQMLGLEDESWAPGPQARDEFQICTPDDHPLPPEQFPLAQALRGEPVHDLELRLGPVGGPLRDVLVNGRQMCARDGSVIGAVVATTDVSVARETTRELVKERRRLAEAKRIGRLGSFSYDPSTGTFTASPHLRVLWGLPPDGPVEELARRGTHPEDAPRAAAAFAHALAEGGRHAWTFRMHRLTDGALRHFSATVEVIHDGAGLPLMVTGIHQDVTELVEAEQRAVRASERFEAILKATPDYTFVTDLATGAVVYGTPDKEILGLTVERLQELGSSLIATLIHPEDQQQLRATNVASRTLGDGEVLQIRHRARHTDGTWHWLSRRVTPFRRDDVTGEVLEVLGVMRDVTDVVQAEEQLTHAALHDPLTGLPNRALLMDRLEVAMARAEQSGRDLAVLFCDLDGFKRINDTAGHSTGDAVLKETADRLRHSMREHDTLARVGGDEFVIIVEPWHREDRATDPPSTADDRAVATDLADRISSALRRPVLVDGNEHFVSASIGITYAGSSRAGGRATSDGLLQEADAAMYRAKHRGKDRFEVFEHGLRTDLIERGRVEQVLRQALAIARPSPSDTLSTPPADAASTTPGPGLTAAYQPVFDLDSGCLTGFEALARLTDGDGVAIPPDVFIRVAEVTGLIRSLGQLMLDEACAQLAAWHADEAAPSGLTMAVNVSALQASHSALGDDVRRALEQHGLAPTSLILELTETALLEAGPSALSGLQQLHDEGVGIAIDDFGTGYASLRYLATLPVTALKIDKGFTAGLPDDPVSDKIVRAVAGLAADMHLACIVEGVETAGQQQALPAGVRVQGYLTGRPLDPALIDLGNIVRLGMTPRPPARGDGPPRAAAR